MRKVKSVRGVEIHRTKSGEAVVYIKFQADGRQHRERIGLSCLDEFGKDQTIAEARRRLKDRRAEIMEARLRGEPWLTPAERAAKAEAEAKAAHDAGRVLLFEEASERFVKNCADKYADPDGTRGYFARLGRAFNGRRLDAITRFDVRQYLDDRANNTGPFADWPTKVGLRPGQTEITALSALYGFVEEEGHEIPNPCQRPRARRYSMTKAAVYRPVRKPVIPTAEALAAIFEAASTATYQEARVKKEERARRCKTFAAFVRVVYFTASRPESEACALTHGDVEIPDRAKVRSMAGKPAPLGTVTFRDTKTGTDRCVPLHPEAEAAVQSIMLEYPARKDGEDGQTYRARVEAWKAAPLFSTEAGQFTKDSYRKAWKATMKAATKAHPELAGMILRDLRKAANTAMRSAGTDPATAARVLGHSSEMNFRYVEATDDAAQRAIMALG